MRFDFLSKAISRARRPTKTRVIYTCLFGYSEPFLDQHYDRDDITDFVCFTDDPDLRSDFWDVRYVGRSMLDPARHSKRYKALCHIYLPEYAESIYIDNTIKIIAGLDDIFRTLRDGGPHDPILTFRHPWRDCVYSEADAVIDLSFDDPAVVTAQMATYRALGYPRNNGLNTTPILVRRHDCARLNLAMQEWRDQVLRHSKRDQLSFNVVAWFHGLKVRHLPGAVTDNDLILWPYPRQGVRVPRDFDDARYLELHPDVAETGMPPRKHYLLSGHGEGRLYK